MTRYQSWVLMLYFEQWYPLPVKVPTDVRQLIYDFLFDPMKDPW